MSCAPAIVTITRQPDGGWVVEAACLGLRGEGATIGAAMTAFRAAAEPHLGVRLDSAGGPPTAMEALHVAEELAEEIVFGEMADEAEDEPGESIAWDSIRGEIRS